MPKSKHNRKNKRTNKGGARPKNRLPEGLQLRAFTIKDEIDYSYQPGIPDELAEATIMLREGRVKEAKTAFERIIEREPRAREAYLNLAVAHLHLGDETTAETLMRQTLDKFPNYAMARINLARTYLHRRQHKEAKEMLLPLDETKQFTSVEFQNYAATWSDILKAEGNSDAAESWKRMLYDVMLKNPSLFR